MVFILLLATTTWYWTEQPKKIFQNPFPSFDEKMDFPREPVEDPWRLLQEWVKDNTPRRAMFFTPPYRQGFRVFSRRSAFCEYKDGSLALFDPEYAKTWRDRQGMLENWPPRNLEEIREAYHHIPPQRWRELSQTYRAEYLVTEQRVILPFEKVHQIENYAVWRIQ